MLLAIDIGNSNVTLGVYRENELLFVARIATDRNKTGDQYAVELYNLFHIYNLSAKDITGTIISSVVPVVGNAFQKAVKTISGKTPMMVGPGVKTGLNIKIDNAAQLGADLVAGAVAAIDRYALPCIILDLGTANTISVVNEKGDFLGGVISAGIGISLDALTGRTAQLPQIGIETPAHVIGTNTIDCMKSGLVFGTAAMIDGLIDRIEEELGQEASLVATGGLAPVIIKNCKHEIDLCDNLLLYGLKLIYEKNITK